MIPAHPNQMKKILLALLVLSFVSPAQAQTHQRNLRGSSLLGGIVSDVGTGSGHIIGGVGKGVGLTIGGVGQTVGHVVGGVGMGVGHIADTLLGHPFRPKQHRTQVSDPSYSFQFGYSRHYSSPLLNGRNFHTRNYYSRDYYGRSNHPTQVPRPRQTSGYRAPTSHFAPGFHASPPHEQATPTTSAPPSNITIINNYYGGSNLGSANSLFGR